MNEQTPLPEPTPLQELLLPEVHPVTGDLQDAARIERNAKDSLDKAVQSLGEAVAEDHQAGRIGPLSDEGLKLSGDTMRASVEASQEQVRRDAVNPPE